MGDYANIVAFRSVPEVGAALAHAEAALRAMNLVEGAYDPDAALASKTGRVLRPGAAAAAAQGYGARLTQMRTNGVEFEGPRYFNGYGLGLSDWFECPDCTGRIASEEADFLEQMNVLGNAAVDWMEGEDAAVAACALCSVSSAVTEWRLEDPVFLADMAVVFWNWPAIPGAGQVDGQWWTVDVTGALQDAVGAEAAVSGYKV